MEEEEFNLNNPNNLNPIVNPVYKSLPQSSIEAIEDSKEERINKWNEKPEVKNNNIKAIDINKRVDVDKKKFEFFKVMSFFGILSLICIAIVAGIYGYILYKDGTLIPKFICGDVNLTCEKQECIIPNIPECPEHPCINNCSLSCGETIIKIINGTGG